MEKSISVWKVNYLLLLHPIWFVSLSLLKHLCLSSRRLYIFVLIRSKLAVNWVNLESIKAIELKTIQSILHKEIRDNVMTTENKKQFLKIVIIFLENKIISNYFNKQDFSLNWYQNIVHSFEIILEIELIVSYLAIMYRDNNDCYHKLVNTRYSTILSLENLFSYLSWKTWHKLKIKYH